MKKLCITAIFLLIVGCSNGPSVTEIESQLEDKLYSNSGNEIFELKNLKKINGFEKNERTYIVDIQYDLVFKKGIDEVSQKIRQESKSSFLGSLGSGVGKMALQMQYGSFKAGDKVTKEEKLTFINTENGWRISE